jgi:signal peptidase II
MDVETHDGLPLRPKLLVIVAVVAAVVVLDLGTKAVAERLLSGEPTYHLLGDTIRVGYALNAGVFLSLGHDLSPQLRFWLFVVGVGGVLALLLGLTLRDARFRLPEIIAVAAIVGGGIGNLCDRVAFGVVRDFLNVGIGGLRTGIFNVADMAITFGGIALLVMPFLPRSRR